MSREYVLHEFERETDLRIDYAAELNPQQHAAVTAPPGPALVLAGAGSGKTRTLTYRVAYLIERGIAPDRVLLLTFTNKAAREMMRRVADLLGSELTSLWGGTFHSVGARILRINAEAIGYRPDFTILDREDSEDLLKACIGAAGIDSKARAFPKVEVIADLLSRVTNERVPLSTILERRQMGFEGLQEPIARVLALYEDRKRSANVMDFDDLLALWLRLMEDNDAVRDRYQRRFQFVLVDEYQDTNRIQSDLIDLLAGRHRHVMVVGDDSQSIYSWRGANFRNILDFPKRYPGSKVYKIETNYRSTPEILAVANAAISGNMEQFAKELVAARKSGIKPVLIPCEDAQQQAAFVGQRVVEAHEEGVALSEIAVLYRSHFHALEVQLEFTRRNIPFVITSGIRFFEQAHIKDVTAWLKLSANPNDELAFKRVALLLPGIGPKAAEKLWAAFVEARARADGSGGNTAVPVAPLLMAAAGVAPKKAAAAWAGVAVTVAQLGDPAVAGRPGPMIRLVLEAFYKDHARATFANADQRLEDLNQLAVYAGQFESLTEFLTQLSLLNNMDAEAEKEAKRGDDDRVRLSSVHQSKGLEFGVVFAIMLCDGLFPSARSLEDDSAIEEERRLFYVAVTRAKDELYLSYPLLRHTQSQGVSLLSPSRFLSEIP
ncbi:MAG: ATP-dependent helicase, partial [Limisphaerales bacterium]